MRKPKGAWALVAVAVCCAVGLTACDVRRSPARATSSTLPPSPTQSPNDALPPQLSEYVAAAERANTQQPETVIRAGARPSLVQADGRRQAMVVRDEGDIDLSPGNYQLVVYCVGAGTLYAHLAIGDESTIKELPPCAVDTVVPATVNVSTTRRAQRVSVILIPVGEVTAGVSYQVRRQ
ncbi:MAG: hypothetical protein IRZ05_10685 [Micromonosporaceae bacterium]|jgi:hypothetical protein|nr:hypothetical protein [Micromonosporaceae bacterium]